MSSIEKLDDGKLDQCVDGRDEKGIVVKDTVTHANVQFP